MGDGYFEKLFEEEQLEKLKADGLYFEDPEDAMADETIVKIAETAG